MQLANMRIDALPKACFGCGRNESFGDIMDQLDASRTSSTEASSSDTNSTPKWELLGSHKGSVSMGRASRRCRSGGCTASKRPLHPKPFGPTRAVGDAFGWAASLPRKDLTPWEQERAIYPERSWGPSAMTCVARERGGSAPISSRMKLQTPPREKQSPKRDRPQQHESHQHVFRDQLLQDQQRTQKLQQQGQSSRDEHHQQLHVHRQTSLTQRERPLPEQDERPFDSGDEQELRRLCERRRRLEAELIRTDRKLRNVVGAQELAEQNGDSDGAWRVSPGGGGGAFVPKAKQTPSGGGPFAGKCAVMNRTSASVWNQSVVEMAKTSYNYLGPSADGVPHPQIHPLWS